MIFTEEKPSEKLVFTLYLSAKTEKTLKWRFNIIYNSLSHFMLGGLLTSFKALG